MNLRKENSRHEESSMDCLQRIFCVMLSGKTDSAKQEYMYTISYNVVQIYDILLCFYDFLCMFNNTSCVFLEKMFVVNCCRKRRGPLRAVRDCEPLLEWLKAGQNCWSLHEEIHGKITINPYIVP